MINYTNLTWEQLLRKVGNWFDHPKAILEALKRLNEKPSYQPPYKILRGLISQSGTNAPTIKILENTLDTGGITLVYASNGQYDLLVQNPIFVREKTYLDISGISPNHIVALFWAGTGSVRFNVRNILGGGLSNDELIENPFEIIIYN